MEAAGVPLEIVLVGALFVSLSPIVFGLVVGLPGQVEDLRLRSLMLGLLGHLKTSRGDCVNYQTSSRLESSLSDMLPEITEARR